MGVGICSSPTPDFQPRKFNGTTIGKYNTDEVFVSQNCKLCSSIRISEKNRFIFYQSYSQEEIETTMKTSKVCKPKDKVKKSSRKSLIMGPSTLGRRFQGIISKKQDKHVSSCNQEMLDAVWFAAQKAQKAKRNSGTIQNASSRPLILSLRDGESTDESLEVLGGEDFQVERNKHSRCKSSSPTSYLASPRESMIQRNKDARLLRLMFYESDSSDSFDP